MALAACMQPGGAKLDEPYAAAPSSPAVYWSTHQNKDEQRAPKPEPLPGDSLIDSKLVYDLPALVDLALHSHPDTRAGWQEAQAAAARL